MLKYWHMSKLVVRYWNDSFQNISWSFLTGLNLRGPQKDIDIGDGKNDCTCELGIQFETTSGSIPLLDGYFWLIKHYNYNNRPIYYSQSNVRNKDLYLYFGTINIHEKQKGWIVDHAFGWMNDALPMLFSQSYAESKCPEVVGKKWSLPNIHAICI